MNKHLKLGLLTDEFPSGSGAWSVCVLEHAYFNGQDEASRQSRGYTSRMVKKLAVAIPSLAELRIPMPDTLTSGL